MPVFCMDAPATPLETALEPSRRQYGRDSLLAIKEIVLSSRDGVLDELPTLASVTQRGIRGKSKQSFPKSRPKDAVRIVLGPQKRTWNTGCHVSHTSARETNGEVVRGGRLGYDSRGSDKVTRFSTDLKKDHRGSGRDRGGTRRVDGVSFSRLRRDDRFREPRHHVEEEPEWFSEGPATVNETIELGRVLEVFEEDVDVRCKPDSNYSTVDSTPIDGVFATASKSDACPVKPCPTSSASVFEPPDSTDMCPISETPGSRFKHLFTESPKLSSNDKPSSVTEQLLRLLKGCNNFTKASSPEKNNVAQVENKLRSILLGHSPSPQSITPDHSSSKPQILTVEEIEAHLNLRSNVASPATVSDAKLSLHSSPEITENRVDATALKAPQSASVFESLDDRSSLVPIFQSLASKQSPQLTPLRPVRPIPLNFLPTPVAQISMMDALSAGSRRTQLQHTDSSISSLRDATHQGVLRHLWNTTHLSNPQKIPQVPNAFPQPSAGMPPGYLPELCSRPGLNLYQPYMVNDTGRSGMPRRPIVKAQQSLVDRTVHSLAPLAGSGSLISPNMGADIDRRLLNLTLKQQPSGCGTLHFNSTFCTTNTDLRFNAPDSPLFSTPTSASANVGATNSATRIPSNHQNSDNSFAFLSQLMEIGDLGPSIESTKQSSFSANLLSSGLRAKTLEEIEHQEVASGTSFF